MADVKGGKPKEKSKSPAPESQSAWAIIVGGLIVILLIGQGISFLLTVFGFKDSGTGLLNPHAVDSFKIVFASFLSTFQVISLFIAVLFFIGILYVKFRMYEMKKLDNVRQKVAEISEKRISERPEPNKKWLKVQGHINSPNPSDWRLSILEADILLNEILEKMGYHGVTIGDKLKSIESADFTNLDAAWEAHKTRNYIAHEGSDFRMNQNEAKKTIGQYEKVFKEFYFI